MDERNEFIYKSELRKSLLRARNDLADKRLLSRAIADKVLPLLHGNVMVYISIGSEVDTLYLTDKLLSDENITVLAPHTENGIITPKKLIALGIPDRMGNLPPECYGVEQYPPKLDCCITPLLGFNDRGYRIGYGKGCYDRFFAVCNTFMIGLAFGCQAIKFEPDATDISLDCCVTEKNVIYF